MSDFNILNLNHNSHIHFVGIGGISMSGLALILQNFGYKVSGSDIKSSNITEKLSNKGITIFYGHDAKNVEGADVVVFTAAVKQDNVEIVQARNSNKIIVERSTLLGQIMNKYKYSLGIAGTHGKTTTTSMISQIFLEANYDPTITVGGEFDFIDGNIKVGNSEYFITEACEYVESFLEFFPYASIILNIDEDHLDYYKDINHITNSFEKYAKLIPDEGLLIINNDDEHIKKFINNISCNIVTFGIQSDKCNYYPKNIEYNEKGCATFDVWHDGELLGKATLSIPGSHNIYNALSAIAMSIEFGISFEQCKKSLYTFKGAKRRFEYKGDFNGITVIDDYAHHPTEINTTLCGAKKYPHNTLWCIFQPHTYSRTKALINQFAEAFDAADKIIIADIYAAREIDNGEIHSRDLENKLTERGLDAKYFADFDSIYEYILNNSTKGDLIITMGAGDIYKIGERLIEKK